MGRLSHKGSNAGVEAFNVFVPQAFSRVSSKYFRLSALVKPIYVELLRPRRNLRRGFRCVGRETHERGVSALIVHGAVPLNEDGNQVEADLLALCRSSSPLDEEVEMETSDRPKLSVGHFAPRGKAARRQLTAFSNCCVYKGVSQRHKVKVRVSDGSSAVESDVVIFPFQSRDTLKTGGQQKLKFSVL